MKKLILTALLPILILITSCGKTSDPEPQSVPSSSTGSGSGTGTSCGDYNGHPVYKGPNGGCYYINSSGNKTYVSGSYCC